MSTELSNVFDTNDIPLERALKMKDTTPVASEFQEKVSEHQREDYTEVRNNLKNVISEVELVVSDSAMNIRAFPSARSLEAFALLIKAYGELNQQLLNTSKDASAQKELKDSNQTAQTINNIVFTGTSESLIDRLRDIQK